MKYTVDKDLRNFDFWSGAVDNAKELTTEELDQLDGILPEYFGEEVTDTDINDMFWFEFETIVHALGYAYINGKIVRDEDDIPEDLAKDKLKENLDGFFKYDDESLEKLYQACLEDGDVFKVDADNDDIEVDFTLVQVLAKEAGLPEEE
jgi:hypothetical protein